MEIKNYTGCTSKCGGIECEKLTTLELQAPSLAVVFDRARVNAASDSRARGRFQPNNFPQPELSPSEPKEPSVCQNLRGEKYSTYIRLTMTRSLGGVSSSLRGRIIRQLFPYKPFPLRKMTDRTESDQISASLASSDPGTIKQEVPDDGNKEVNSMLWTDAELKKHDEEMRGWARWDVDKGAEVVRSTKCTRLTSNTNAICDECHKVSEDESLKADVRKVAPLLHAGSSRRLMTFVWFRKTGRQNYRSRNKPSCM